MNENNFIYGGKKYIAIENCKCEDCAFKVENMLNSNCCLLQNHGKIPQCSAKDRKDGKSVVFIEKGNMNK